MSRFVCIKAPWVQCVADGARYLAAPGEDIITVDPTTFEPSPGDVVLAPHMIPPEHLARWDVAGVSFYETENLLTDVGTWKHKSALVRAETTRPWFNYSAANAKVYGDQPWQLQVRRQHAHDLGPARDIDVLFIGSMSPQRAAIIQALDAIGIRPQVIGLRNPVFMPELAHVLRRTKVLLNVHYYRPGVFESFRCIPALSHGCAVVSEVSAENEGAEHCVVCNYEGLVNGVRDVLEEW